MLYLEYKRRELSAELHICAKGINTALACEKTGNRSTTGRNA